MFSNRMEVAYTVSDVQMNNRMELAYTVIPIGNFDLLSSIDVIQHDNLASSIEILKVFSNSFIAEYFASPVYDTGVPSSIDVTIQNSLESTIEVIKRYFNKFTVEYFASPIYDMDVPSEVGIKEPEDFPASIRIPHTAELFITYDAVQPPIVGTPYPPVQDAFVREYKPALNYGAAHTVQIGTESGGYNTRALYQFDFQLGVGDEIESATLRLYKVHRTDHPVTLRFYKLQREWLETGVTWLSQPPQDENPFLTVEVEPGEAGPILIDVEDVLYDLTHDYGFAIETDENSIVLTSKEFTNEENRPTLFVFVRNYLVPDYRDFPADIAVRNDGHRDVAGSIVVESDFGFSYMWSHIHVHRPDYIYGEDIDTSIAVTRRDMHSSITVRRHGVDELESEIWVSQWDVAPLDAAITVVTPNLRSRLSVRRSDAEELVSSITTRALETEDISASITASKRVVPSFMRIRRSDASELVGNIDARLRGTEDFGSHIAVSRESIQSVLRVRLSDTDALDSSIIVPNHADVNLPSSIDVRTDYLISHIYVRNRSDFNSRITVRQFDAGDLSSTITIESLYHEEGYRISTSRPLDDVYIVADSVVEWEAVTPPDTEVVIETSLDGGETWHVVPHSGAPIPGVLPGDDLTGKTLLVKQTLKSKTRRNTPILKRVEVAIFSQGLDVPFRLTAAGRLLVASDLVLGADVLRFKKDGTLMVPGHIVEGG